MTKCFRFGEFTLYPEIAELHKRGRRVRAGAQPVLFLAALMESPGKTVTREKLAATLWLDNCVGKNSLNVVASVARKLLADNSAKPRFIKTVGRVGYTFIHEVETPVDGGGQSSVSLAEKHFYKAKYLWELRTEPGLKQSIDSFKQAIAEEPSHAGAYAGLADAYTMAAIHGVLPPREGFLRARAAAARALQIDPALIEAECSEAWVRLCLERNWSEAEKCFAKVIRAKPTLPFAWNGLALLLVALGRATDAVTAMQTAWHHDAISPPLNALLAQSHYYARQFYDAIEQGYRALSADQDFAIAHACLGMSHLQLGDHCDALDHLERASDLSGRSPIFLGPLGHAYAVSRHRDKAQHILKELLSARAKRYVLAYPIALTCAGLGETESAFTWLQQACDEHSHWILFLKVEPMLDNIRPDARFASLLKRIGLDDDMHSGSKSLASVFQYATIGK